MPLFSSRCALLAAANSGPPPQQLTNSFATGRTEYAVGDTFTLTTTSTFFAFDTYNMKVIKVTIKGGRGGKGASTGANGGIVIAELDLTSIQDTSMRAYIGGNGTDSPWAQDTNTSTYAGGYNGGGAGRGGASGGGGGRSDIRIGTSTTAEIIVAGGGGGGLATLGTTGTRVNGAAGCGGFFGEYEGDNAGGGGGYNGGAASCTDDGKNGGAGTNFIHATYLSSSTQNSRYGSRSGGSAAGYCLIEVISVN